MDDDDKAVTITHFINPYQFWYCSTDEDSYIKVRDNEEALSKFYKDNNNGTSRCFQPDLQVGKKIAVRFLSRNKYIRARVEYIKRSLHSVTYIAWALDHGFPFETKAEYCRILPKEFDKETERVQCGGIEKIVPAEKEYDYLEEQTVTIIKDKWSERACNSLEKIITDAASIEFIERLKTNEQNWGDLIIRNHRGKTHHASDFLINEDVALRHIEKFKQQCLSPRRIIIPVWQSNNGNNKFIENTVTLIHDFTTHERPCNLNDTDFQNAQAKVAAWSDFNKRAADYVGTSDSVIENSDTVSTICDTDTEFASTINEGFKNFTSNQRSVQHKKVFKKLPPAPSLADFGVPEVIFGGGSNTLAPAAEDDICSVMTSESQKSLRTQHLLKMREKSRRKHAKEGSESGGESNQGSISLSSKLPLEKDEYDTAPESKKDQSFDTNTSISKMSSLQIAFGGNEQASSTSMRSIRTQRLNELRKKSEEKRAKQRLEEAEAERSLKVSQTKKISPKQANMIPAGFDLANLNTYNKKDHWHRKETTRNEHYPHNQSFSSENSDQNQDFRFTRDNTDKYKSDESNKENKSKGFPLPSPNTKKSQSDSITNIENKNLTKYSDALEDNEDDEIVSNASSQVSMYSAFSNMDNEDYTNETFHTPTHGAQKSNITNEKENLLENFIMRSENSNENHKKQVPIKKNQLFFDTSTEQNTPATLLIGGERLRIKYLEHTVLAHCQLPLNTTESLNKIFLAPTVRNAMQTLCITDVYRTQTYAWPHLVQGNSAFIVNCPESGKTWSYIPAICTSVSNCIENQFVPNTYGPVAIIIVASAKHVINVANNCAYLLHKLEQNCRDAKTVGSYGIREFVKTKIQLMEACGILVVTPPNLKRLFHDNERKDPLFDPQRLQHIIIDDIDVMLTRCKDELQSVFKTLYTFVPKKNKKLIPQLVITSRFYLPILKKLISISNQPLLVMGDFLEAAVYGKAKICIEFHLRAQKLQRIIDFIKVHPFVDESLMILCNSDDDVYFVGEELQSAGIDCLGYHSEASTMARDQVHIWKNAVNARSKVLVCSDGVLPELELQNVQNSIHFSLATSWTKLKLRFSVHIKMYENLVVNGFDTTKSSTGKRVNSLILLDEGNNLELPRLIEFLKYHNQEKLIPPNVLTLSNKITMQLEIERRSIRTQICNLQFEYGDCNEPACSKRHVLIKEDIVTSESNKMPLLQNGDLRMVILNVFSPTYYTARLIEHRLTPKSNWHNVRQSDKFAIFTLGFNMFYSQTGNLIKHWPINVNDICVYEKKDTFHRARVLKVQTLNSHNIIKTLDVTIKLIDTGNILEEKSDKLYVCDEKFKSLPAQAVDIRLIGLLPFDNERNWDEDTTRHVKGILIDHLKKNNCVHANICCSLVDTIFVRDVVVMEKLPTLGKYIFRTDLRQYLAKKKYGIIDTQAEERTFNIIKKYGLEEILKQKQKEIEEFNLNLEKQQNAEETNTINSKVEQKEQQKQVSKATPMPEKVSNPVVSKENKNKQSNENSSEIDKKVETSNPKSKVSILNDIKKKIAEENQALVKVTPNESIEESLSSSEEDEEKTLYPVCSVLDFLETFRRCNQQDAEDCGFHDEDMPDEVRDYFRETDLMCQQAIMAEQQKRGIEPRQQAIMEAPKIENSDKHVSEIKASSIKKLQTVEEEKITEIAEMHKMHKERHEDHDELSPAAAFTHLPRLKDLHKRPETVWYETKHLIILSIKASDINDYDLEISKTDLYFKAIINDVENVLVLNFLGTIKPELVSHEIRGTNVIVRLVKSIFMRWPRLLKQTEKMTWLNYNFQMLNVEEIEKLMPEQFYGTLLNSKNPKATEDDSDSSDDNHFLSNFKTFNQITNPEDIHDPLNAEIF